MNCIISTAVKIHIMIEEAFRYFTSVELVDSHAFFLRDLYAPEEIFETKTKINLFSIDFRWDLRREPDTRQHWQFVLVCAFCLVSSIVCNACSLREMLQLISTSMFWWTRICLHVLHCSYPKLIPSPKTRLLMWDTRRTHILSFFNWLDLLTTLQLAICWMQVQFHCMTTLRVLRFLISFQESS